MERHFDVLDKVDYDKLTEAIALITVYVAGADGTIDKEEKEWAEKVTKFRSYNLPGELKSFYKDVGVNFAETLDTMIDTLPSNPVERNPIIAEKLEALNPILAQVDPELGAVLYDNYKSFAKHVAKATGGFMGVFSIGPKEAKLIELEMLTPISK